MKRPRPTPRELLLIFAPFPLLWIGLGVFVHPAVFRFWVAGQSIGSLSAMTLVWVPLCFTIFYGASIAIARGYGPVTVSKVFWCALISLALSALLSPIP